MTDTAAVPGRRLGLLLWVAGMLGAVVMTTTVLPQLLLTRAEVLFGDRQAEGRPAG